VGRNALLQLPFAATLLVPLVPAQCLGRYFVCMCVNAGMWFERFIIIVGRIAS